MPGGVTLSAKVTTEIFPGRVQRLLDSPDGAVGQHVRGVADGVHETSRGLIGPKGYSGTTGKPRESRPSSLRDAGSVVSIGGAAWSVVYDHPIARIHHNGAASHTIPDGGAPNKTIRGVRRVFLYNEKLSWGPVYHPVRHPGSKGNPYLTNAAEQRGLRASGALRRGSRLTPIFRSSNFF